MNLAHEVAEKLLEIGAVQINPVQPFIWASGLKSPIYCDNRLILSYPEIRSKIKDCMAKKVESIGSFDYIAGVATAGIAHGMLLADHLRLPYVYVRCKAKGHGKQNLIEGKINGNPNTLVVEDLISTGGSSINTVIALREAGVKVDCVLSIFSYGLLSAQENFNSINCNYYSLCDYETMIKVAEEKKYILSKQMNSLKLWRESPTMWSKNN